MTISDCSLFWIIAPPGKVVPLSFGPCHHRWSLLLHWSCVSYSDASSVTSYRASISVEWFQSIQLKVAIFNTQTVQPTLSSSVSLSESNSESESESEGDWERDLPKTAKRSERRGNKSSPATHAEQLFPLHAHTATHPTAISSTRSLLLYWGRRLL